MKMLAILTMAAALAACQSAPTVQELQTALAGASELDLCKAVFLARREVAQLARAEAESRGLDCSPYANAIVQGAANDEAARRAAAMQLLLNRPAPAQQPIYQIQQQTQCTSQWIGNQLQTICR